MKRKDSKGRVLKENEIQRPDGRYEYRYRAIDGSKKSVYSWRLTETDATPQGKKKSDSLRELEGKIIKDSLDGIAYNDKRTLNECWERNLSNRTHLKDSTKNNYTYMYNLHVRNSIGVLPIKNITYTMVKTFFNDLITVSKFKPPSVETYYTILRPVFVTAVKDGLIRLNPADGVIAELRKSHEWNRKTRHPLTKEQTKVFLTYIKDHKIYGRWYSLFLCLLYTGCRIGEFLGLRWQDIKWKDKTISIDHNLIYRPQENGKMEFHVTLTKTKNSTRIIPMFSNVSDALKREFAYQSEHGFCTQEVDGYSGFIWHTINGGPQHPSGINDALYNIVKDYNKEETEKAAAEKREPVLLPKFSVHVCRHTFCTRLCEEETDLKLIQEIMGHANITTTMDIYNECNIERKIASFDRLEESIV